MRSSLLEKAIDNLIYATNKVLVADNKKPWCLVLNLKDDGPDANEFRDAERKVAEISKAMGKESVQVKTSSFSESAFDRYLESAPHLKKWAEANPAAAKKLKSCPSA
jgi:hypothetical protein